MCSDARWRWLRVHETRFSLDEISLHTYAQTRDPSPRSSSLGFDRASSRGFNHDVCDRPLRAHACDCIKLWEAGLFHHNKADTAKGWSL